MKKLINIIIFTLIIFSFVGCFDNGGRDGGFPYLRAFGVDSVYRVSNIAQSLDIPIYTNRELNITFSTDEYTNNDYPNGNTNDWISGYWDNQSIKISLQIEDNLSDYEREKTVTISSNSSLINSLEIKVIQDPIEYSGDDIFQGDAILSTQEEYNAFMNKGYKEVRGNLIIGTILGSNKSKTQNSSDVPVEIDGTTYYFAKSSGIDHLSPMGSIKKISGGAYIVAQNTHDKYLLPEIIELETLVVIYTQIEGLSFTFPERPTGLKRLQLNNNNISDISFLSNMDLGNLETLYLGHGIDETNTITEISALSSLTTLREIHLNYLPIPIWQLNNLSASLPNAKISTEGIVGTNPEQIYEGDLLLRTQEDINNFISGGYTEVTGSIIIGNSTTSQPQTYLRSIRVNNTSYYFTQSKSALDLSSLNISHVEERVYLIGFPQITDLSMISSLAKAEKIEITHNNNLTDISTLSKFSKLKSLHLRENQISDISPIGDLTKLYWLNIANEDINDATPLLSLNNLTNLYLSQTKVSDIYPLSNLTNLTQFSLSYNTNIRDYSHINNMTNLQSLQIYSEHVNDLTPIISRLTNLTGFTLGNSMVTEISPIGLLTKLTSLTLSNNKITDLSALSNLTELSSLQIHSEQISDLAPLYPLKKLRYIYLSDLPLITIANINALTQELPNSTVDHWGINN